MKKLLPLALASLALTGCSLSAPSTAHLQITMPAGGFGSTSPDRTQDLSRQFFMPDFGKPNSLFKGRNSNNSDYPPPEQLSDFQCAAIMVTAADIPADPVFTQACGPVDASGNPINVGVFGGFVSSDGGTIDIQVQNGSARQFQLIGLQYDGGACPTAAQVLSQNQNSTAGTGNNNHGYDLGNPYVISTVTQDVGGDETIVMNPSFNPAQTPAFGCSSNHGGNGGSPQLYLGLPGNSGAIRQNTCIGINIGANNANGQPLPAVSLAITGSSDTFFYADETHCGDSTGPVTGPFSFPAGQDYIQLYMKSGDTLGTQFTVQLSTTAAGWTTQNTEFNVVSDGLMISTPGAMIPLATCQLITITTIDTATISSATQFDVQMGTSGSSNNSPPPSVGLFLDSSCASPIAAAPPGNGSNNGSNSYIFHFPTSVPSQQLYVKDPAPELLYFTMVATDNSIQPGGNGLSFGTPVFSANYSQNALAANLLDSFNAMPTSTGGSISSCTISGPALPAGLSFNTSNCMISGSPTGTAQAATGYTITAFDSNMDPSVMNITIQITDQPVLTFSASGSPTISTSGSGNSQVWIFTGTSNIGVSPIVVNNIGSSITSCTLTETSGSWGGITANGANCGLAGGAFSGSGTTATGFFTVCHSTNCVNVNLEFVVN